MENQKKITIFIVVLVLISLAGILVVQAGWLNKAVLTNNEIFQQKVDLATKKASELYLSDTALPGNIHRSLMANTEKEDNVHQYIQAVIEEAFNEANLPLSYTYGLYKHEGRLENVLVFGDANETVLASSTCTQKSERSFGWANLTCNKGYEIGNDYHLAIFPSFGSYVFNEVKWSVITSVIFIALILFGFLYTLNIIRKQRKLSALKNDFINNLTHEFKTPLFSISLASKTLRKNNFNDFQEKDNSYLDVIDNETNNLKTQVEKILQLSMLDAGKLHIEKEKIDLHQQLKNTVKSFHLQLNEKNGKVDFNFNALNSIVLGDRQHLKNVWYNIVDNAIKHNQDKPEITIATQQVASNIIAIYFRDNGIGVKKENQKMIFERFYRETDGDIHNTKGFGVGLSYANEILKLHNATISLEESGNSGSSFKIIFPTYDK